MLTLFVREYGSNFMANDDDGDIPLHLAAFGGSLSVLCSLIDEFWCDPNTKGSKGRISLHCAAQNVHADIVSM